MSLQDKNVRFGGDYIYTMIALSVVSFLFDYRAYPFFSSERIFLAIGRGAVLAFLVEFLSWLIRRSPQYQQFKQRRKDRIERNAINNSN